MPAPTAPASVESLYRVAGVRAIEAAFLANAQPPLMERAGAAAARHAMKLVGAQPAHVLVLCGPGNNGGDGFVMARHLLHAGHRVSALFAGEADKLPSDAHEAHGEFLDAGGHCLTDWPAEPCALAVDALFGIGLARAVDGVYAKWIERFNALPCPRLAIDIPSGLDADTGRVAGPCARATHTLTFIAHKPGLYTLDGPDHSGAVSLDTLDLAYAARFPAEGRLLTPAVFAAHCTPRVRNSHKGTHGDVVIVGGAAGMSGAALLAGSAALQAGAGRVFAGLIDPAAAQAHAAPAELMLRDVEAALDTAAQLGAVLAIGPGLGQGEAALAVLRASIETEHALVLDADALNLIAAHPVLAARVRRRTAPTLITPHPAEAARLLATSVGEVQADRVAAAQRLAAHLRALTVLKGAGSVLATPEGGFLINTSGNPGLAAAGMGDMLTGIVAALLAQGWPAEAALSGAVWLHGAAADELVARGEGPIGLTAGEVARAARTVLNRLCTARA